MLYHAETTIAPMHNNPYTPPQANVDTKEFKQGKWYNAILLGFLVDFIGTMLVSILLSVLVTAYFMSHGMKVEEVRGLLTATDFTSPIYIASLGIGLVFSILGGYICARIANHHEYRYVAIIGLLDILLGLVMSPQSFPTLHHLALTALSFAALFTGAYLHVAARRRAQ